MRILVVSDTHKNLNRFWDVFEKLKRENPVQMIVHCGDYYEDASAIRMRAGVPVTAVRGNCDAEVDQMLLNFDILRDCATIFLGGRRITATHGHLFPLDPPPHSFPGDIYLYGHIHIPVIRQENGITLLNPGSITLPKQNSPHTYGLLDENGFTIMTEDHEVYQSLAF